MADKQTVEQYYQENEYWFPYHYIAQFKENQFKHYFLDTWAINYVSTIEYLLKKIIVVPGARIVDIGCGDGRFSRELALAFQSSFVVGIDYSTRAIEIASALNSDIINLHFHTLDITDEHNLGPYDIAVLMEVFEHIPIKDTENFIKSVRVLLKDRGELFITVPHMNKPLEYKHFQHFSCEKIVNYLQPYFTIAEIVPFERILYQRTFILKILHNKFFIPRNPMLLSFIYKWYKRKLFFCESEKQCQRIFIKAIAK